MKIKYVRSMKISTLKLFAFKRVAALILGQIERGAKRLNKVSGRWTYNCTSIECCNIVAWALGQNVRRCHGNRDASPSRWVALSSHTRHAALCPSTQWPAFTSTITSVAIFLDDFNVGLTKTWVQSKWKETFVPVQLCHK